MIYDPVISQVAKQFAHMRDEVGALDTNSALDLAEAVGGALYATERAVVSGNLKHAPSGDLNALLQMRSYVDNLMDTLESKKAARDLTREQYHAVDKMIGEYVSLINGAIAKVDWYVKSDAFRNIIKPVLEDLVDQREELREKLASI